MEDSRVLDGAAVSADLMAMSDLTPDEIPHLMMQMLTVPEMLPGQRFMMPGVVWRGSLQANLAFG